MWGIVKERSKIRSWNTCLSSRNEGHAANDLHAENACPTHAEPVIGDDRRRSDDSAIMRNEEYCGYPGEFTRLPSRKVETMHVRAMSLLRNLNFV
jgi:hypothetical protein